MRVDVLIYEDWGGLLNVAWYSNAIGTVSGDAKLISMLVSVLRECLFKDTCSLKCTEIECLCWINIYLIIREYAYE